MTKQKIIVAIDPDVHKSGVAVLDKLTKEITLHSMKFPEMVNFFQWLNFQNNDYLIVIEAGWENTVSNFHTEVSRKGQRIAKNVGANHQTGKHLAEMAEYYGLEVITKAPLLKCWKGRDRKITHAEIVSITGYKGETNQETRDALLLAWDVANLPIKLHV